MRPSRRYHLQACLPLIAAAVIMAFLAASCGNESTSVPDTTAPAAISDLEATATGCESVTLAWTAPGDDGNEGRASSYDVRYSTAVITAGNWASATQCAGEPTPKTAGQAETFVVGGLTIGTDYHFACKATDDNGNESNLSNGASATVGSTDIAWVKDGLADDEEWSTSATSLSANWSAAGCVTGYEYAIGTTEGATDVAGWTACATTSVTRTGLMLADGETYYISVKGVAGTTKGDSVSSDGVTVDISAPDSRVDDLSEEVVAPVFEVSWSGSDATSGIKQYDIQVSSDGGNSWDDWLTAATLTWGDFTGVNGHTYYFRSRACDNAGNVEAYPATADAHTTVTLSTSIAWVHDGLGADQDWTASASQLSANWATAGFADSYEIAIGTSQGATNVLDWTAVGAITSVTRGSLALSEGETYYFSVRSVYGGSPAAPTSSNGITVDLTKPASQVEAMPEEVYSTIFPVAWHGSDAVSGVKCYDIQVSVNGGGSWVTWLAATPLTSADYDGAADVTYQFRSRAYDNAGNMEDYPATADAQTKVNLAGQLQVDHVNDGTGDDVDWTNSQDTLYLNWPEVPGAEGYQYAIGYSPGATDFRPWSNVITATSASYANYLNGGWTYYASVRVVVGASHGPAVSSDGITVDRIAPSSSASTQDAAIASTSFLVSWAGSDNASGISSYNIQARDGAGDWYDWVTETDQTSEYFSGQVDHTYYFRSQATDSAGNVEVYPTQADAHTCVTCTFAYESDWGQSGSGDERLGFPFDVATDADGNVYVADNGFFRVKVFDPYGGFIRMFGSAGEGDSLLDSPAGVAVDDSGYVYVSDFNAGKVRKYTTDGAFVTAWGTQGSGDDQMVYPRGIAVDDSFYVYVAEQGNERIHKFTSSGVSVKTWGGLGDGDGQFSGCMCLAVAPSGDIYAVDAYHDRVQQFTANGVFIRTWGSYGPNDGQFFSMGFIAVDAAGHVYVADGCHIHRFTPEGVFLNKWGGCGDGEGEFLAYPYGITVHTDGTVYVTDMTAARIVKFVQTCP
jgi:hypothetical protein